MSKVDLFTLLTTAPISFNIVPISVTSLILGIFSILQGSSQRITPGIMATAAFFAPLIVTSPFKGFPPFTTNLFKTAHSNFSNFGLCLYLSKVQKI